MKITRIEITDYRGIAEFDRELPPGGAVIAGRNAGGKTSVLRAIGAALAAEGCSPSDVRAGAERAEIVVNLDDLRVRRSITRKGTSLTVKRGDDQLGKPQTRLHELLGSAAIDPLGLFLAKAEDRRRMILEAVPIEVKETDVWRWVGDDAIASLHLEPGDLAGHGLEVVDRLHKRFYDRRTASNRRLKDAVAERELRAGQAAGREVDPGAPEIGAAEVELVAAEAALRAVENQDVAAELAESSIRSARDWIAGKRAEAVRMRDQVEARLSIAASAIEEATLAHDEAIGRVRALEDELAAARADEGLANEALRSKVRERERLDELAMEANRIAGEADADERAIVVPERPSADRIAAARDRANRAREGRERARLAAESHALREKLTAAQRAEKQAAEEAKQLDRIVVKLSTVAPADIAARTGIAGLTIVGDEVALDGVSIETLSGAEQMRFAVEIARRANARAKILVVDGLERLDGVRGVEFVRMATADGWQLIATRVADGELRLEAIEVDDGNGAARSDRPTVPFGEASETEK